MCLLVVYIYSIYNNHIRIIYLHCLWKKLQRTMYIKSKFVQLPTCLSVRPIFCCISRGPDIFKPFPFCCYSYIRIVFFIIWNRKWEYSVEDQIISNCVYVKILIFIFCTLYFYIHSFYNHQLLFPQKNGIFSYMIFWYHIIF